MPKLDPLEPLPPTPCSRHLPAPFVYFPLQMVDYMKTSMSMRTTWPLKPEDQKIFEDFDFVSNKVFEEELNQEMKKQGEHKSPFG